MRQFAEMEADDSAVQERDELPSWKQNGLLDAVLQFVLIPLAAAAIIPVMSFAAAWVWSKR